MARPRKAEAREDTRGELIEAAWRLFSTAGYDATPVEAIIDAVGLSKGAFYYYFNGKEDVLDAVVGRMVDEMALEIEGIPRMSDLSPMEKINRFMESISSWKLAHLDILSEAVKVIYRDENAIIRYKMNRKALREFTPVLAEIIRQGIEEGVFEAGEPEDTAELILLLSNAMAERQASDLVRREEDSESAQRILHRAQLYLGTMEKILGAPASSIYPLYDKRIEELEQALKSGKVKENGA
ncbi:MAG: TetR/AcrR family transcriptional regulator [Actinobacteria bacterium]|nr:TetR/AcrR family transcriptional regulator [Actinomycetota bacterium]